MALTVALKLPLESEVATRMLASGFAGREIVIAVIGPAFALVAKVEVAIANPASSPLLVITTAPRAKNETFVYHSRRRISIELAKVTEGPPWFRFAR